MDNGLILIVLLGLAASLLLTLEIVACLAVGAQADDAMGER